MLIVVGSTRPAKVEAARATIAAITLVDERFRQSTIRPVDVAEVAPRMPMTERAILEGARIRAQTLIHRTRTTGCAQSLLAIGVEGGSDPLASHGDHYVLKTWAAVTDRTRWGFGAGGAIVLPDAIAREVLKGRELGDLIDELAGTTVRGTRGAWGVLTLDLVGRQDSFRSAILAAVAPFYNPALYQA
jgi:inosine/xanthosine triphosphatase